MSGTVRPSTIGNAPMPWPTRREWPNPGSGAGSNAAEQVDSGFAVRPRDQDRAWPRRTLLGGEELSEAERLERSLWALYPTMRPKKPGS